MTKPSRKCDPDSSSAGGNDGSNNSTSKKQKTADANELAGAAWQHYRNYLDSCGNNDEGDHDELRELLEITSDHIQPHVSNLFESAGSALSVITMLPILISVAHYHLADAAISEYLQHQAMLEGGEDAIAETNKQPWHHVSMALKYYPHNAGAWSMGANFGRMSKHLSPAAIRQWYEKAVSASQGLRPLALKMLEDEDVDALVKEWIELLILHQVLGVEFIGDDDDDNDDNDDNDEDSGQDKQEEELKDEEDEGEDEGYYSYSMVEATSRFMLAMLLSTAGDHDKAMQHLQHFALTHRIHPNVWQMAGTPTQVKSQHALFEPLAFRPQDGFLPKDVYQNLLKVFAPDAAFWKESDYSNRGYYSFFGDINGDGQQPTDLMEDVIIRHLLPRAKEVLSASKSDETICGFEWWAHTRPIQANLGHNLHFDTDESMLAKEGKVTHPVISSVLYLTGGNDESEAGATIVFDQPPQSEEASHCCWKSTPHDNTFMMFPGNLLHGVLPCPGKADAQKSTQEDQSTKSADLLKQWHAALSSAEAKSSNQKVNHRLTVLVGFWTRNVPEKMTNRRLYGPCGPLPPASQEHTWVQQLQSGYASDASITKHTASALAKLDSVPMPLITPAWEEVKSSVSKEDEDKAMLIPHGIDHRFFVKDAPQCFFDSLMEDRDENEDIDEGEGEDE